MEFDYSSLYDIHEGTPPVDASLWWLGVVAAVAVIVAVIYVLVRLMPYFKAYSRLQTIKLNDDNFVLRVNYWLKQTCLISHKRKEFARLYGHSWLNFLDGTGNTNFNEFRNFWDAALTNPEGTTVNTADRKLIIKECKKWIRTCMRRRIWAQ